MPATWDFQELWSEESETSDGRLAVATRHLWKAFFGDAQGAEWYAAGLTWQQALEQQRAFLIATFGENNGNLFANLQLPTPAAYFANRIAREAERRVLAAESKMHAARAELARLKRRRF
jgi:hypothetical protein